MIKQQLQQLFTKYLDGRCSESEVRELLDYFKLPDNEALLKSLINEALELDLDSNYNNDAVDARLDNVYQKLKINIETEPAVKQLQIGWRVAAIAASLLVFITVGLLLVNKKDDQKRQVAVQSVTPLKHHVSEPGGAILTLANGEKLALEHIKAGSITKETGARLQKNGDNLLVYLSAGAAGQASVNTLETPRGKQYQLVLADGTKVWLNAASSLRFPTAFPGNERSVELHGEAYFEVAKDATKPFTVKVNSSEIRVLGTHFNIMAYDDERTTETTLLEGSVRITHNGHAALLKPGQKATIAPSGTGINVKEADLEEAIAWQQGYFVFDEEPITSVMRKVARWYDVDIDYKGAITNQEFNGSISRYKNVTEVLKMLELTGAVHFKIEERRIIVMP